MIDHHISISPFINNPRGKGSIATRRTWQSSFLMQIMVCSPRKLLAHANKREGVVFTVALNVSRNTKNLQIWKTDFNFLSTIFLSENLEYKFQLDSVPLKIFCSLSPTVQSHNYFCVHSADKVNSDTQISKTSELFFSHVFAFNPDHLTINVCLFFFFKSPIPQAS